MNKAQRLPDYLAHILESIDRILRYTHEMNEVQFLESELVQDAVIRNIEIMGEAANNIQKSAPEYAGQHAHIPWQVMYTMRNRVAHAYDSVDLEIVWKTIQHDLPALRKLIQAALLACRTHVESF